VAKYATDIIAENMQMLGGRQPGDDGAAATSDDASRPTRAPAPAPRPAPTLAAAPGFSDMDDEGKSVAWHVAMKRSKRKALPANKLGRTQEKLEQIKASVRAKVEHPFQVVKNLFRHRKTRYRGLAKNTAQLFTLFAFANLVLSGRRSTIPNTRVAF
jgi:hypothetical protein